MLESTLLLPTASLCQPIRSGIPSPVRFLKVYVLSGSGVVACIAVCHFLTASTLLKDAKSMSLAIVGVMLGAVAGVCWHWIGIKCGLQDAMPEVAPSMPSDGFLQQTLDVPSAGPLGALSPGHRQDSICVVTKRAAVRAAGNGTCSMVCSLVLVVDFAMWISRG